MCVDVSYPKRAASSAIPEEGIFLFVLVLALSVLKQKENKNNTLTRNYHH